MAAIGRVEAMNASPTHSKVRIRLELSSATFVAGGSITGKMELECRADGTRGLALGGIKVELIGSQELSSRDHSAMSTFLSTTREFQGKGLPPSNAVHPFTKAQLEDVEFNIPRDYYPARKGTTTFFYSMPIPESSPSSISFQNAARIRYVIRASVQVLYRGEPKVVTGHLDASVTEALTPEIETGKVEAITVGESGKLWMQAALESPYAIAGSPARIVLTLKNHTPRATAGLSLALVRSLYISRSRHLDPNAEVDSDPHISDTPLSLSFKDMEYTVYGQSERTMVLNVDIPSKNSRGVKSGSRLDADGRVTGCLFDIRCVLTIAVGGMRTTAPLELNIPIMHPIAVPEPPLEDPAYPGYNHHHHHHRHHVHSPPLHYEPHSPPFQHPHSPVNHHPHYNHAPFHPHPYQPAPHHPDDPYYPYYPHHDHQSPVHSPPIPPDDRGHTPINEALHLIDHEYQLAPWGEPYMSPRPDALQRGSVNDDWNWPAASREQQLEDQYYRRRDPNYRRRHPIDENHEYVNEEERRPVARRVSNHLRNSTLRRGRSLSPAPVAPTADTAALMVMENPGHKLRPRHSFDNMSTRPTIADDGDFPTDQTTPLSPERSPAFDAQLPMATDAVLSEPIPIARSPSVLSPRPGLSPRQSYENVVPGSPAKSDRVVQLERIVAKAELQGVEPDAIVRKEEKDKEIAESLDKTLPKTPRGSQVESPHAKEESGDIDMAELLRREGIEPVKGGVFKYSAKHGGLDILEKRLLKDVGTRKVPNDYTQQTQKTSDSQARTDDRNVRGNNGEIGALEKRLLKDVGTRKPGPIHPPKHSNVLAAFPTEGKQEDATITSRLQVPDAPMDDPTQRERQVELEVKRFRKESKSRVAHWLSQADVDENNVVSNPVQSPIPAPKAKAVLDKSPFRAIENKKPIPDAKYDVRSARGGRGGVVTSVAALWANAAKEDRSTPKASPPGPSKPTQQQRLPPSMPVRRATEPTAAQISVQSPQILSHKSPALPAQISSKLASPHLSSTASLARPTPSPRLAARTAMPTISEVGMKPDVGQRYPPIIGDGSGAGKAKLKELIRKYDQAQMRT